MENLKLLKLLLSLLFPSAIFFILYYCRVGVLVPSRQHFRIVSKEEIPSLGKILCGGSQCSFRSWQSGLVTNLKPEISKDCKKLFDGDMSEVRRLESIKSHWKNGSSNGDVLKAMDNCSFVKDYFNNNLYTTKLEHSFPIAFVFVVYNSPQQIVRLLKLLYRPHNQYCFHPDLKSGPDFINLFRNISGCLDNVHVASKIRDVRWGHKSIMESMMGCYKDLMEIREKLHDQLKWNYVINLCGKELPLKTNHQIVSHLLPLNGTSMLEAKMVKPDDKEALRRLWKSPVPHGIPYAKATAYMALSPSFINFLLTNSTAIDLYEFFRKRRIPEEHYFPTMYMLPNVPGGHDPNLPKELYFSIDRYLWVYNKREKKERKCHGKLLHNICLVDIGDLNWIIKSPGFQNSLFQNKYFMEHDHLVMDCMEEKIISQNKLEYKQDCQNLSQQE